MTEKCIWPDCDCEIKCDHIACEERGRDSDGKTDNPGPLPLYQIPKRDKPHFRISFNRAGSVFYDCLSSPGWSWWYDREFGICWFCGDPQIEHTLSEVKLLVRVFLTLERG
jgi:hypothetical protein